MAELPSYVYQYLRDAEASWNKLLKLGPENKAKWTRDQMDQLSAFAEIMKHHHNILKALIDSNSP
jgi:hypothetical protein